MKLFLNGQETQITCPPTLQTVREHYGPECDVCILNGYATGEDLPLHEGDRITLIRRGDMPSPAALEDMLCARHTPQVHERVKKARIGIAGLGGLGSNVALLLARTGVETLVLVDFDVVEPSNLNRQAYFVEHLGLPKTEAMRDLISRANPYVQVQPENLRICHHNAAALFKGCDVVCECLDAPDAKAELVDALLEDLPGTPVVAASGMAGYASANEIRTRKAFGRLYLCGDGVTAAQPGQGLMAPRVTVCAAHQANMALRLLLGLQEV